MASSVTHIGILVIVGVGAVVIVGGEVAIRTNTGVTEPGMVVSVGVGCGADSPLDPTGVPGSLRVELVHAIPPTMMATIRTVAAGHAFLLG